MLICDAMASIGAILPMECTPTTISFSKTIAKLYLQGQDTCIAVLVSEPLDNLLKQFPITLVATVCGKKQKSSKSLKRQVADPESAPHLFQVRIFVYGLMEQEAAIGDALSRASLFLQHPGAHEIDESVKYHNPQYLLPPGQDMPPIETLRVSVCCRPQTNRDGTSRSTLQELERSQILKIFDSAYEVPSFASIEQSARLLTELKKHQLEALVMMVEKEAGIYDNASFPTLWKPFTEHKGRYQHVITERFEMKKPPPVGGGILADEMGLGKTLSTLSLICYSLDALDTLSASSQQKVPRATLIVTPNSTIYGWEKQIKTHIKEGQVSSMVYHGQGREQELHRSVSCDIVLTTYDTLRSDLARDGPLFNQEWARVVLDEAHKIRNSSSKVFKAVFQIPAQKRWCLTGTPIQNSLADFGALLSFVGVPPFEDKAIFAGLITRPIQRKEEGSLGRLRTLVAATTLRRTKAYHLEALGLSPKTERVQMVELSGRDRHLYEFFKRRSYLITTMEKPKSTSKLKGKTSSSRGRGSNILVLIGLLRLICNHGEALLPESAVKAWRNKDANSIDWDMLEAGVNKCVGCDSEVESLDATESIMGKLVCGHTVCTNCASKTQMTGSSCSRCGRSESSPSPPPLSASGLLGSVPSSPFAERYVPSDKVEALLRNIADSDSGKHVIFSYWTKMLDQIATAIKLRGLASRRIDGQASLQQRKDAIETFSNDPNCNIMLASTGAAGEGIDLTTANTVHLMEPHWNPMAEAQAIDRVHRIGQQQDVTVIRYVASDSIEMYVQWVQEDKLRLIKDSLSGTDQSEESFVEKRWNRLLEFLE
ncbi:hypothetical protein GQ53DRAFT_679117 [Thozetella sp. PMI_491]|nr:hypothetical protein GQ53DRAFT_679117 [Thozetella sp. PMI_491]